MSDLLECQWRDRTLTADFVIPGDEMRVLRVRFGDAEIVRILDEMPLSTEEETTPNGGEAEPYAPVVHDRMSGWEDAHMCGSGRRNLETFRAMALAAGLQLVPAEPSPHQCAAGSAAAFVSPGVARAVYRAMLAADEGPL